MSGNEAQLNPRYEGHHYGDGCPEHPALPEGRPIYRGDPIIVPVVGHPVSSKTVLIREILTELRRAEAKFPDQHLPSGTPEGAQRMGLEKALGQAERTRDMYRKIVKDKAAVGTVTWWDVLREEFYEVGAETDPEKICAELVQVAAMCFRWALDLELGPDRVINVPPDPIEPDAVLDARKRKERDRARHPSRTGSPQASLAAKLEEIREQDRQRPGGPMWSAQDDPSIPPGTEAHYGYAHAPAPGCCSPEQPYGRHRDGTPVEGEH